MRETILSVLAGQNDCQRVVVALCHFATGPGQMVLRHETWSEDVGWFAQSTIELSSSQVGELRSTLGLQSAAIGSACRECVADQRPRSFGARRQWAEGASDETGVRCPEVISMVAHRAG